MNPVETSTGTFAKRVSAFIFIAGVLTLGLGGLLLLSGIAYAMVTENLALGLACGLLLFAPYILGFAWFFGWGTSLMAERVPRKAKELATAFSRN